MESIYPEVALVIGIGVALATLGISAAFTDGQKETPRRSMAKRAPWRMSLLEMAVAIIAGVLTWIGVRYLLYNTLPYPCSPFLPFDCGWTYDKSWRVLGAPLFADYAIPMAGISAMAAVFFVRGVRRDVAHFSAVGNFALAWPLIGFPLLNLLGFLSPCCAPIGLGLGLAATARALIYQRDFGNLLAVPLSMAWLWYADGYYSRWMLAFGD